ncbi:MAG: serine/threonine-protein kinase [Candidatus Acidiferrales bacterium]
MPLAPGTHLGPYEISAPLGAGGMGEVYRARDTRLERTVAIKILPQHLSNDPIRKQRFEREAKTISGLNHPNICVLYDVGNQDGIDYLVMECVEGETLAKRLEKGPMSLEQVLKYGMQIADALDKAHRNGVVHGDLKPGNIMLTATGAKLLDFGLAKPAAPLASLATLTAAVAQSSPMTEQGTIVGTFQYMSPEQVEGKELDGRSDIFSLGAVLYEMLTGKRAFEGKTQLSVASAILEREPEPLSTVKPVTPPSLERAIQRCLAKDPEERWQAARDLAIELKWIAQNGGQSVAPANEKDSRKFSERLAWLLCGALVIGLAVGTIWWRNSKPAEQTMFFLAPLNFAARDIAIAPNGHTVAVVILFTPSGRLTDGLHRISASGGTPTRISAPDVGHGGGSQRWPMFLPDGKHYLFLSATITRSSDADGVYVGLLDSNETHFVVKTTANAAYAAPGYLLFCHDKTLLAQRLDANSSQLTGEPTAVVTEPQYLPRILRALFAVSDSGMLLVQKSGEISLSRLGIRMSIQTCSWPRMDNPWPSIKPMWASRIQTFGRMTCGAATRCCARSQSAVT